jgi:hypothetical protein
MAEDKPDRPEADDDPNERKSFASPPCLLHELDPSYLGYLSRAEVLGLLNELLEAERAGARGVGALARDAAPALAPTLHEVAVDEARFCAMLTRHIERLGGTPSTLTGAFYDKLLARPDMATKLRLLDRGQGWVVERLREALGRLDDEPLQADLRDMLAVHERNIARCADLS